MAIEVIYGRINVDKLTPDILYPGKFGRYLNFTLIPGRSKWDKYAVMVSLTKEQIMAGVKGKYIGGANVGTWAEPPDEEDWTDGA